MKCPNCSFENSDDSKQCKICGYDLPIKITPPSKKFVEDDDDEELDSALKSLFGLDEEKKTDAEEDPLDVATVERMLHRKRQSTREQTTSSSPTRQVQERKEAPKKEDKDDSETPQYSLKIIFIVIAILILLVIIFKTGLLKLPWKYQGEQNTTQIITTEEMTESTEATTEVVINLGNEAQLAPVNTFFDYLPEFVNKGNLNILTLFKSSQEALDVLTTFSSEGNIEKIQSAKITASEINESDAAFTIDAIMDRLIEGKQTKVISTWDFHVILDKATWSIDSLGVTSQAYNGDVPSETTTSQETTAETTQETTTATTSAATTEPVKFDYSGFITSGSFTGGKASTGQDIGSARYGNHNDFERIAFDVYKWNGGSPQDTVDEITSYTATISADGKKITISLTGTIDAYASLKPLELAGSPNVESVKYSLSGPNESVQIDITLKSASQFKVFSLKSPARLVVDIAVK